jgi:hypothetical protein
MSSPRVLNVYNMDYVPTMKRSVLSKFKGCMHDVAISGACIADRERRDFEDACKEKEV